MANGYSEAGGSSTADLLGYIPLTRERLQERSDDVYSSGIFTLVSILQGATLALLATSMVSFLSGVRLRELAGEDLVVFGRAILVLSFMAVVVYEYTWFGAVIRRPPSWLDAFVPIALGAAEIGMAAFIEDQTRWWVFTGGFLLLSSLALYHSKDQLAHVDYRTTTLCQGKPALADQPRL